MRAPVGGTYELRPTVLYRRELRKVPCRQELNMSGGDTRGVIRAWPRKKAAGRVGSATLAEPISLPPSRRAHVG